METQEVTALSISEIKNALPDYITLRYVDYGDNLDGHVKLLQEVIQTKNNDSLYELTDTMFVDQEFEELDRIKKEIKNRLLNKDYSKAEIDEFISENSDEIDQLIYEKDSSGDIIKDLLRNTSKVCMFYDTGISFDSLDYNWEVRSEINRRIRKIKSVLKIKTNDYDKYIDEMVQCASYGGNLNVYFYDDVETYFELNNVKRIRFRSIVNIGIVDSVNGSGFTIDIPCDFDLKFFSNRLFIDKANSYSWTKDIAGCYENWAETTIVEFINYKSKKVKAIAEESKTQLQKNIEIDKKYQETYDKGDCTIGDTNFNRHRKVIYINDYPCGHKCLDCGTFWID